MHKFDKLCGKNIKIVSAEDNSVSINPSGQGYNCLLSYKGRSIHTPFTLGAAHYGRKPQAGEVVHCLMWDGDLACDTDFKGWCSELGYNSDSIEDKSLYEACIKEGEKIRHLLGDDYDTFREAAEDY